MYLKIHQSYRNVVALCDAEISGKKFEEGIRQLDIRENFYKDRKVTHAQAVYVLRRQALEDATFNIVGKKSIAAAIDAGLITKKDVTHIAGIPLAIVF